MQLVARCTCGHLTVIVLGRWRRLIFVAGFAMIAGVELYNVFSAGKTRENSSSTALDGVALLDMTGDQTAAALRMGCRTRRASWRTSLFKMCGPGLRDAAHVMMGN